MRQMRVMLVAAVMVFAACSGRESVTGAYGQAVLAGQVVVDGQASSAEGVEVSVSGTGMATRVGADGAFVFADAPDDSVLTFRRASDGIDSSLRVAAGEGPLVIELAGTTAKKSSRRRSAGRGAGEAFQFEGVIVSATPASIVVFTSKKEEVTIAMTPQTVIRKGHRTLTATELLAGSRVHVKALQAGTTFTAIEVKLQESTDDDGGTKDDAAVREYEGTVRSASATQLVVFTSHREEVTFTLNAATEIRKGNTPVLAAAIQVGWRVHVKATETAAGGTKTATRVTIQNQHGEEVKLTGTVKSVAAASLVITTAAGDVTVQVSSSTQIRKGNEKVSLSAITVGSTVEVEGRRVDATTVDAKKITTAA